MSRPATEPAVESWTARREGVSAMPVELVEPLEWEPIEGKDAIRLAMDAWDRPSYLHERVAHILEGLEAGEDLPEIVERLEREEAYSSRPSAHRNARSIVLGLAGQGNVEIGLPPVPDVFGDRFERVEELGRGAVGVVWRCRDRQTGRDVVVKHAWNWTGELEARDENLRKEASLMAELDHPAVVSLVDGIEVEGRFYLVREFVHGEELADHVFTEGNLDPEQRIDVTRQVADLLDHMHERSVLCLDLKPANLMLEPSGRVRLTDLGHSRSIEDEPLELSRVPGTRGYLGPEIVEDHQATRATDVFGLGRLHVFNATAYPPKQSDSRADTLERLRERAEPRDGEEAFLEACLAPDPDDRPTGAGEAADLLD